MMQKETTSVPMVAISVDAHNAAQTLLSAHVREQLHDGMAGVALHIAIQVLPQVATTIVDDLATLGIMQAIFVVNVGPDAQVDLQCRFVEEPQDAAAQIQRQITLVCSGRGAVARLFMACKGQNEQRFVIKTVQDHQADQTTSEVIIKGVFDDASRLRCDTLIRIPRHVHAIQADQENKNLLLSPQARAITIPKLEVEANDVRCSHGAAVSRVDAEQLWYVCSRGIAPDQARALLIEAFLS